MDDMRRQALKRKGPCNVFWGSHGCSKQHGHIGLHWCSSDCIPCDGPHVFGDDWDRNAYIQQVTEWIEHRQRLGKGLPAHRPNDWRLPRNLDPAGWEPKPARQPGRPAASKPVSRCYLASFGMVHVRPGCVCLGKES